MRFYELVFENQEKKKTESEIIQRISFPEAASKAYMVVNELGFKWRVKSVKEIKNTEAS